MTDALSPGSIAFTGFNADGDDSLAFVSFSDIKAGTLIHFTDSAWNGKSFATDENVWSWTATSDVAAGTIISMTGLGAGGTASSNVGAVAFDSSNARDIADANEVVYAYTGDASAPVFLTAITNAIFSASLGRGTLNGTGLLQGVNAKQLNASPDIAAYVGDRSSLASIEDYKAHIYDTANWKLQGGDGDQSHDGTAPDLPFSNQAFTADPTAQRIEFASVTASVAEGDSGDTVLTVTLSRIGSTSDVTTFSGTVADLPGMYGYADAGDFGGTLPTFSGSFADGASTATVTFHISGDTTYEPDEHFYAVLDTVTSESGLIYIGDKARADSTIVNDDPVQFFGFAENSMTVSQLEGNAGDVKTYSFVVERTGSIDADLSFSGVISTGLADAADFGGTAPLTFSGVIKAGESTATVTITTTGDDLLEGNDSFSLHLTGATSSNGTTIVDTYLDATGIIGNDDPLHIGVSQTVTSPLTIGASDHLTIDLGGALAVLDPQDGTYTGALLWSGGQSTGGTTIVDNAGIIGIDSPNYQAVSGTGVTGSFTFNNGGTGIVHGTVGFRSLGSGSVVTVKNAGVINGDLNYALNFVDVGKVSTVTVNNARIITNGRASFDVIRGGPNMIVNNGGTIRSAADDAANGYYGGDAIDYAGSAGGVVNNLAGVIEGSRHAITNKKGMAVTNNANATLIGRNGSGINVDNDATEANAVYVTNHGTIIGASAGYEDSDGDAIDADGLLKLNNFGLVEGIGANGYHDGEANVSEGIAAGGGIINNYAGGMIYGYGRAIQVDDSSNGPALGATTIYNEGQIRGDGHGPTGVSDEDAAVMNARIAGGEAINIVGSFADSITNSGGILGGVKTDGGDDTLTNSGLMVATGGSAIDLGDGNDSFTNSGIVSGDVLLGDGDDTINLVTGSIVSGTIDGYLGFDTINLSGTGQGTLGKGVGINKVDVQSGAWAIDSDAFYVDVTVESGAGLVVRGTVLSVTVAQGAGLYVYGTADGVTVLGEQAIHAGGVAIATTIGAGGEQNVVEGAAANGTTIAGGTQHLYGAADDTTIGDGGLQHVHGYATNTTVDSGGEQNVYASATASGVTLNAGAIQITWGTADFTAIHGGIQYVYGIAGYTGIWSGTQFVGAGGLAEDTTIGNGGTQHAFAGGSVRNVSFAGADATLVLDRASDFSGLIYGWQDGNHLDLSDIQFGADSTTLAYAANAINTGGTLTISDGARTVSLDMLGQYTAADFALSSDGHGGTMISDPGVQVQNQLAAAHA